MDPETASISPLAENMPKPYAETPSKWSQAHRWVRRVDWEALNRHVGRLKEQDTFNTSWMSFCLGVAASAFIGFLTVLMTSSHHEPHSVALLALGGLTVGGLFLAFVIRKIDQRARANQHSLLSVLQEEMTAMESYIAPEGTPADLAATGE